MADYRTPLPGILAALLEGAVNRVLALDERSPGRLRRLSGRTLQLDIEGLGITLPQSTAPLNKAGIRKIVPITERRCRQP